MKSYIIGLALFILFMVFTIFQADYNRHQEKLQQLKYIAEEAAAAAAQYIDSNQYRWGNLVFNQTAGNLAADRVIKKNMELDSELRPSLYSSWYEQVTYTIHYFDDLTVEFPYEFHDSDFQPVFAIGAPTVLVILNAGQANYRFYQGSPDILALAAHEWQAW